MSISRRRFIAISAGFMVSSIAGTAHANLSSWRGVALGADAKLDIHGVSELEGERLISLARAEIDRLENIFSIYRKNSAISLLNQRGTLTSPAAEMLELLSLAKGIHASTGGRFDPTVQPLWALYAETTGQPSINVIERTRKSVGLSKVEISPATIRFNGRDMAMTLNGIAQGFITDRVVSLLKAEGLENAVVNIGEISALGHDSMGDAWKIGLAETGDQAPDEFVRLVDRSIATSAPRGTTFDGKSSHIIDPLSGEAVRSPWKRISVIHKSAAIADGLSTAMVMMDEKQLQSMKLGHGTNIIALAEDGSTLRI